MEPDGSMRKQERVLESHERGVEWRDALKITSLLLDDNIESTCFYSEVVNYKSCQLRSSRQRIPISMVYTLMAIETNSHLRSIRRKHSILFHTKCMHERVTPIEHCS
jgi:catechol-2,3-dioxygenase